MFKFAILLNSSVTMLIMVVNFIFKIYLTKHFSQLNLVAYYTALDMFSLITRVFIGYKDALITLYYKSGQQEKILKLFSTLFGYVISFVSFVIIPIGVIYYLEPKIDNVQIEWWMLSLLFILMNVVSYFGYIFLLKKEYSIVSLYDVLKSVLIIVFIMLLYHIFGLSPTYQTLLLGTILAYFGVLAYFIIQSNHSLKNISFIDLFGYKLPNFKDNTKREFIVLSLMASGNYFVYGLLLLIPVFVMLHFDKLENLANYQVVARSIYFSLVAVFSFPLGRFMLPEFSKLIADREFDKLYKVRKKLVYILIFFGVLVVAGCWILSEVVIGYLFPLEYKDSYKILNILIVALPFVMYTNFSRSVIKSVGEYKLSLFIYLSGIVLFFISYIELYMFDIAFASIFAFVFAMIEIFLLSLFYERRILARLVR